MEYIDISGWESKVSSTRGTRDKKVVFSPEDGSVYFMKFPMVRDGRDYSMETWSEIIAYEIGIVLGFHVLKYDFAVRDGRPGCISRSMVEGDCSSLVEGDSILSAFDPTYDPNDKEMYNKYTFSFVMDALDKQGMGEWKKEFVRMLLFDAVIGNSDRHQGNWGFVRQTTTGQTQERRIFRRKPKECTSVKNTFTPIYDSGCCLGREFSEEQILQRLQDRNKMMSYINKGLAELRTDEKPDKKVSHFELLEHIIHKDEWKVFLTEEINGLLSRYDKGQITRIIGNIDTPIPEDKRRTFGMSDNRKRFIVEVIDIRINKLKSICHEAKD